MRPDLSLFSEKPGHLFKEGDSPILSNVIQIVGFKKVIDKIKAIRIF